MQPLRRDSCTIERFIFYFLISVIVLHITLSFLRTNIFNTELIYRGENELSSYHSSDLGWSPYSVIVSYAVYAPTNASKNKINALYSQSAKKFPNIHIVRTPRVKADLIVHGYIMKKYLGSKKHFIMLNCGSRGPYFNKNTSITGGDTWIDDLLLKLDNTTKAIGSTISCEVSPHIQSYFIAVDRDAAKVFIDMWTVKDLSKLTKLEIIRMSEVGASKALLDKGYNINSLESRYNNVDFRQDGEGFCKREFEGLDLYNTGIGPQFRNPTVCRHRGHLGCTGAEPCEVMFVKFEGEAFRDGFLSNITMRNVEREDRAIGGMCATP
eukprot:gene10788-22519_t